MTEQIVGNTVDLGAPVIGYESAGELLAGEPIPPPPELREDDVGMGSVLMVGLLALIAVLVLLIGAVKKCQRKQVDEPETSNTTELMAPSLTLHSPTLHGLAILLARALTRATGSVLNALTSLMKPSWHTSSALLVALLHWDPEDGPTAPDTCTQNTTLIAKSVKRRISNTSLQTAGLTALRPN